MRVVTRGAVGLAVRTSGDDDGRPPVLLVHGMGSDHTTWRKVAGALRAQGRCVAAVDLRGHGRSGRAGSYRLDDFRDDLRVVVDDLGADRVDVVAHSLGAHAALRMAMAEPERIGALVLEEVPPMPRDEVDVAEDIEPSAPLGERMRGLVSLLADPRPYLMFDRRVPDEVLVQFKQADPQWWADLSAVDAPALVVSGGARSFLPPQHLAAVADALPAARFHTIDAGHSVHQRSPRAFIDAAVGHLTAGTES
mgnify:CR=1 FL=1